MLLEPHSKMELKLKNNFNPFIIFLKQSHQILFNNLKYKLVVLNSKSVKNGFGISKPY